jgi:hypothetical protein
VRKYPDVARIVPDSNDTKMNTEWWEAGVDMSGREFWFTV